MRFYLSSVRPPLLRLSGLPHPHLQTQVVRFPSRDISQAKRPPKPRATPQRRKYEPKPQCLPRADRTKPPHIHAAQTEPHRPNEANERAHGAIRNIDATVTASLRRHLQIIRKKYLRALSYLAILLGYLSFAHAREDVPVSGRSRLKIPDWPKRFVEATRVERRNSAETSSRFAVQAENGSRVSRAQVALERILRAARLDPGEMVIEVNESMGE